MGPVVCREVGEGGPGRHVGGVAVNLQTKSSASGNGNGQSRDLITVSGAGKRNRIRHCVAVRRVRVVVVNGSSLMVDREPWKPV